MEVLKYIKWVIVVIFILIFILWIKSFKKDNPPKSKESKTNTEANSPKYDYTYDTVYFSGEYSDTTYLPGLSKAAFINATEPYCVINKYGNEKCGQRKQDISSELGDTEGNTELRFKSQSGKHGRIIIRSRAK
jgi:hypothetical protein